MKKLSIIICLFLAAVYCNAQRRPIAPGIPHYKILKADSTYTNWTALKKNQPVMIIYFLPDCSHCQHLMEKIKQNMSEFTRIQLVLITDWRTQYPYMQTLRDFSKTYDLPKYNNITMGTEYPDYLVNDYYRVRRTPFIAIYDKRGRMTGYLDKPDDIADVISAVKKVVR